MFGHIYNSLQKMFTIKIYYKYNSISILLYATYIININCSTIRDIKSYLPICR